MIGFMRALGYRELPCITDKRLFYILLLNSGGIIVLPGGIILLPGGRIILPGSRIIPPLREIFF